MSQQHDAIRSRMDDLGLEGVISSDWITGHTVEPTGKTTLRALRDALRGFGAKIESGKVVISK